MIQIYSINKLSQVKYHKIIPFYNQNHLDDVCFNQVGERQDLNYNIIETMFFQQNLGLNEIKKIIKDNDNKLYEYISTYGENISKNNVTLDQIEHLKRNYQVLINVFNEAGNQSINNFSLHFIITLSNGLIKNNRIDQAKQILKKCQVYVSSSHSDPILLITCLNNLANLHKMKGKRYKSLVSSLKALEIMQTHMNKLREKKQRQKLREDAVVFLIVIIRCKHTLSLILNKNENKQYRKAYDMMNYLGYRSCLKYLGKQSIFIKKFTPVERQLHLPVFKTEQKLEKRQQHQSEKLILQQLNKIHDVLKSKQNPDILVVNTNSALPQSKVVSINQSQQSLQIIKQIKEVKEVVVTQSEKSEKEIPRIPRKLSIKKQEKVVQPPIQTITQVSIEKKIEPQKEQEVAIVVEQQKEQAIKFEYVPSQSQDIQEQKPMIVEETIYVDKWQVKLIQQKERDQVWGKIMIESYRSSTNKKKNQNKKLQICEQKLQKIINQLNIEDKLPYQIFNQQLNQEFIEHYITPFLSIDKQGNPSISFKAKSLVQPFSFKIFNQQSLIFFNHVRNNLFRISISPYNSYKSIYLNVQFDFISMLRYFTFQQQVNDFFTAIFKSINKDSNVTTPTTIKDKNKTCKIINQYQMATYLKQIIAQFQNLLIHREDQTSMNQVLENELFYYKFKEINSNKQGTYYVVRYLPGINCFDIYLKNNYETYSIEGKAKARGNILYKSKQFLNDFGVPIKCSYSKKKLFSYIQIIVRKYTLMIFQKPLAQCQYDAYIENAILEFPICDNCFKTKTLLKQNYSTTLTISLLSINSQFPVGIKIIEYNPEQCLSRGFFIHIVPQQWLRPVRRAQPIINKVLFKAYIDQFDFRRDYFLPEWLQKKGFDKLFQRLLNPYHTLYLQNNINRFIRGRSLEGIFNKQDII